MDNENSFKDVVTKETKDIKLSSDDSKNMLKSPFTWPLAHEDDAIVLKGEIPEGKPTRSGGVMVQNAVSCYDDATRPSSVNYTCYAVNIATFPTPDSDLFKDSKKYRMVPMSSQFYTVDVKLTPKAGTRTCDSIEAYRIIVNGNKDVVHSLDYPASSMPPPPSSVNITTYEDCGLFGVNDWCLRYQHQFTRQQYKSKINQMCIEGKGSLIFRLPPRSINIDPRT